MSHQFHRLWNQFYLIQFFLIWEISISSMPQWPGNKNRLQNVDVKKLNTVLEQNRLKSLQKVPFECPGHYNPFKYSIMIVVDLPLM